MPSPTERFVDLPGARLHVLEAGRPGDPVVLLAHGFPELAYSWRHQIPVLAAAGYHVLAPDQRGYGRSAQPEQIGDYNIVALSGDLIGLLDTVGAQQAALVGHDWGAPVVWNAAQQHPDRVAAVVGMSVPPVPRAQVPPTQAFRAIFGDNFFYMLHFQQPGVADAELGADVATTMRTVFGNITGALGGPGLAPAEPKDSTPDGPGLAPAEPKDSTPGGPGSAPTDPVVLPDWISEAEYQHYVTEFTRTGFTGGLNWYRNLDRNWELTATNPPITAPAMFIGGTADPVLSFMPINRATEVAVGPYRAELIEGAGHWVQQERPDEVNALLLNFLAGAYPNELPDT